MVWEYVCVLRVVLGSLLLRGAGLFRWMASQMARKLARDWLLSRSKQRLDDVHRLLYEIYWTHRDRNENKKRADNLLAFTEPVDQDSRSVRGK